MAVKIISFQAQNVPMVDQLGRQQMVTNVWGLGDDGKMYLYDFNTLDWTLKQNQTSPKPEPKKS